MTAPEVPDSLHAVASTSHDDVSISPPEKASRAVQTLLNVEWPIAPRPDDEPRAESGLMLRVQSLDSCVNGGALRVMIWHRTEGASGRLLIDQAAKGAIRRDSAGWSHGRVLAVDDGTLLVDFTLDEGGRLRYVRAPILQTIGRLPGSYDAVRHSMGASLSSTTMCAF